MPLLPESEEEEDAPLVGQAEALAFHRNYLETAALSVSAHSSMSWVSRGCHRRAAWGCAVGAGGRGFEMWVEGGTVERWALTSTDRTPF